MRCLLSEEEVVVELLVQLHRNLNLLTPLANYSLLKIKMKKIILKCPWTIAMQVFHPQLKGLVCSNKYRTEEDCEVRIWKRESKI